MKRFRTTTVVMFACIVGTTISGLLASKTVTRKQASQAALNVALSKLYEQLMGDIGVDKGGGGISIRAPAPSSKLWRSSTRKDTNNWRAVQF